MIEKLEDIGFYTLSNNRAQTSGPQSAIQRAEILITDRCNFKCPYCRGVQNKIKGELSNQQVRKYLDLLISHDLTNVRFTGGEPTLHHGLIDFVDYCARNKVKRIAISTNGAAPFGVYEALVKYGVNDFSISLDGGCCSIGDLMSGGVTGAWDEVVDNIKRLSKITYVTVGMVFTELNIDQCVESVKFAADLGVQDIRVIPSAQYNKALTKLINLPQDFLSKFPILKYRIENIRNNSPVRGIFNPKSTRCPLVLDDLAIAGKYHFPCIIYIREGGKPIGVMDKNFRRQREHWFLKHNSFEDKICRESCLDICQEYDEHWISYHSIRKEKNGNKRTVW